MDLIKSSLAHKETYEFKVYVMHLEKQKIYISEIKSFSWPKRQLVFSCDTTSSAQACDI